MYLVALGPKSCHSVIIIEAKCHNLMFCSLSMCAVLNCDGGWIRGHLLGGKLQ